jgi:Fe2+ transport system protein FeoA
MRIKMAFSSRQKKVKMVKENILRVLKEEKLDNKGSFDKIRNLAREPIVVEYIGTDLDEFFTEGLQELSESGYVKLEKNLIYMTEKGFEEANTILSFHQIIENYFLKDLDNETAHRYAHILEHLISFEVEKNLKRIMEFEDSGEPLTQYTFTDKKMLERIISMGLCPGQRLKIITKISDCFIVKSRYTHLAIDKSLCEGILVAMI